MDRLGISLATIGSITPMQSRFTGIPTSERYKSPGGKPTSGSNFGLLLIRHGASISAERNTFRV